MLDYNIPAIQTVRAELLENAAVRLFVRREDQNHPTVSGNKWWKLRYNLEQARALGHRQLLTFGGAFSNHIFSTAAAAGILSFESIGIIRGEKIIPLNNTLRFAEGQGMKLHFVSRLQYGRKTDQVFLKELRDQFGDFYHIPEGGTNRLALQGCEELGQSLAMDDFDFMCLPVGTGGTMAGIIAGLAGEKQVIGFSVLKGGEFLTDDVNRLLEICSPVERQNWRIETRYHGGGYARSTPELISFITAFEESTGIPLDRVYTGKMMLGIYEMIKSGSFPRGSSILALHTGGLQNLLPSD